MNRLPQTIAKLSNLNELRSCCAANRTNCRWRTKLNMTAERTKPDFGSRNVLAGANSFQCLFIELHMLPLSLERKRKHLFCRMIIRFSLFKHRWIHFCMLKGFTANGSLQIICS